MLAPRPGVAKARHGRVDQTRVRFAELLVAEAKPFQRAGAEILDQHVAAADQGQEHVAVGGVLEVQGDAFLAAIERQRSRPTGRR